jgi:hypothetical protein
MPDVFRNWGGSVNSKKREIIKVADIQKKKLDKEFKL